MKKGQSHSFSIRIADISDLEKLTDMHMDSFRPKDHVPVKLGWRYVKSNYRWLINNRNSYTLVAEADGKLVGLIAVCDGSFTRPMFKAGFGEFCLVLLRRPGLLFDRNLWERLLRRSASSELASKYANLPGFAQMTIGAVAEGYRGKGVFPALIEATSVESKTRGSKAIRAGMYKSNRSVHRAFEKAGWVIAPVFETEDTLFFVKYLDPEFENIILNEIGNIQHINHYVD